MKLLTLSTQKDEARECMKTPNMVVFFYMEGCPHCEGMKDIWEEYMKKHSDKSFAKIETSAVPDELAISGFPHFVSISKTGKKKSSPGSKKSVKELEDSLSMLGSSRRRTRSRKLRRRTRKRLH